MNWGLLKSFHGVISLAIGVAALIWFSMEGWPLGLDGKIPNRALLLGTGYLSYALLCIVTAFVIRKYAHRGGYSPEFLMRTDYEAIERGNKALISLQSRIGREGLKTKRQVQRAANSELKKAKAHRVNRAIVEMDSTGRLSLRVGPREPLRRMAKWMQSHLWYGTLFGPIVLLHGGLQTSSSFGQLLFGLVAAVWVSGIVGFFAWAKGPSILTKHEKDLSIEEAHSLHASLTKKIQACFQALEPNEAKDIRNAWSSGRLQSDPNWPRSITSEAFSLHDLQALLGQESRVRVELKRLRRIRWCMMGWKLVHVPAAIALIVTATIHVFGMLHYNAS